MAITIKGPIKSLPFTRLTGTYQTIEEEVSIKPKAKASAVEKLKVSNGYKRTTEK